MATQVYVIKVRSAPPPKCQLLPSERRYSAQGVLGLACVHLSLACLATVLASLRHHALGRCFWPFVFVPLSATVCGIAGLLSWKRWYEDIHIRVFLVVSCLTCLVCGSVVLADTLTAADLHNSAELHSVITALVETFWSAMSALIAWRGVCTKWDDNDVPLPSTPLAHAWPIDAKGQERVLKYLKEYSRPPVEGKEKGDDNVPEVVA